MSEVVRVFLLCEYNFSAVVRSLHRQRSPYPAMGDGGLHVKLYRGQTQPCFAVFPFHAPCRAANTEQTR